jgi:hypothetical protein
VVFSTNKTDRHDFVEILLKVALNTINCNLIPIIVNRNNKTTHTKNKAKNNFANKQTTKTTTTKNRKKPKNKNKKQKTKIRKQNNINQIKQRTKKNNKDSE